jgi:hypothetical protein
VLQPFPRFAPAHVEAARLDLVEAAWKAHAGGGPTKLPASALASAKTAIDLDPRLADAYIVAAEACLQLAAVQPSPAIEDCILYAKQARDLNPRLPRAQRLYDSLMESRRK